MNHINPLDTLSPTDPHENTQIRNFSPPTLIEMGEEGSEYLESIIREQTGEIVVADEDWTRLSGKRSIDTSVVGGFMYQADAGIGCWIEVTENGNRPVQISIDQEQEFAMFLVAVLRHEEWTTSGRFHLRFLRRVPVSDRRCTARIEEPNGVPVEPPSDSGTSGEPVESPSDSGTSGGPVESPSDSGTSGGPVESPSDSGTSGGPVEPPPDPGTSSVEDPGLTTADTLSTGEDEDEVTDWGTTGSDSTSEDTYLGAPFIRTQDSEDDDDLTDVEDYRGIGAAALG